MVVVVVGRILGRVLPLVVVIAIAAVTYCRTTVVVMMVVVVREKMMICIQTQFLGLILDPGQTQGYV